MDHTNPNAFQKSESFYRHLFDAAPDVLMMIDREGRVRVANSRCRDVLGHPSEEVVDGPFLELLAEWNRSDFEVMLTGILEGLRTKVPPTSKDEFNLLYKYSVTEAAALDIVPAILWLAENEKPDEATDLFLRAAKLGDSEAMMKLGRLYLRKGTPADDAEGFRWLNKAYSAPKPNLEAGAFIMRPDQVRFDASDQRQADDDALAPAKAMIAICHEAVSGNIRDLQMDVAQPTVFADHLVIDGMPHCPAHVSYCQLCSCSHHRSSLLPVY